MKKIIISCFVFLLMIVEVSASEFSKNNPDIDKYNFARSYITALSYFKSIDNRWTKTPPKKIYASNEITMIRESVNYLVRDNADLRIGKNYLIKYLNSPNALIKKTADIVIFACDQEIAINNNEKKLWEQWLKLKTSGLATKENEKIFVKQQREYSLQRKEVDKTIIEASILLTKVLRSDKNSDEKGYLLAISKSERKRLLEKLDQFAKSNIDWGLKPGQQTIAASVAVIREILEDPVWITNDARK